MRINLQPDSLITLLVLGSFAVLAYFACVEESQVSTIYAVGDYVYDSRLSGLSSLGP